MTDTLLNPDYLRFGEQTIADFSDTSIEQAYADGFVFVRPKKGLMVKTRSVRIDLSTYEPSSENRRIVRKMEEAGVRLNPCAVPYGEYHWSIGKMGKDFYDGKFGKGTFSANKVKELFTDADKSNFNAILAYLSAEGPVGYCISRETERMMHYSYPFYAEGIKNLGIGMMTLALQYAQEKGKQYIYLGSAQRPADTYKMQFSGFEWFDGGEWSSDLDQLKDVLAEEGK